MACTITCPDGTEIPVKAGAEDWYNVERAMADRKWQRKIEGEIKAHFYGYHPYEYVVEVAA